MKITLAIIAAILFIDVCGFMAWALSGQQPQDDVYVGTITAHVIEYLAPRGK